MAVEPQLSDAAIASLMEIPHPSKEMGASIYGVTKVFPDYKAEQDAMIEYARKGAIINTTWMF